MNFFRPKIRLGVKLAADPAVYCSSGLAGGVDQPIGRCGIGVGVGPEALAAQPPETVVNQWRCDGCHCRRELVQILMLRGGGRVVQNLGGQPIHQNTQNPQQRQLLNVVEEMAIAAGLPVPPVYLIPENSINAFAAGYGQDDAVIGINQGTLTYSIVKNYRVWSLTSSAIFSMAICASTSA